MHITHVTFDILYIFLILIFKIKNRQKYTRRNFQVQYLVL